MKHPEIHCILPFESNQFLMTFESHSKKTRTTVFNLCSYTTSQKHLRTKVTPDFHLKYSKNGGNLGRNQNDKNG